jgi:hypothetical protein
MIYNLADIELEHKGSSVALNLSSGRHTRGGCGQSVEQGERSDKEIGDKVHSPDLREPILQLR